MPVIAVNIIKVLFALVLYGFLFYVARAMRGHVAGPPTDPTPTPVQPSRRSARSDDSPPPAPQRFRIQVGTEEPRLLLSRLTVGRSAAADITVDDAYASDVHAAFEISGDQIWVEDLGSTNGTVVGGERIEHRTPVPVGETVLVGRTPVVIR